MRRRTCKSSVEDEQKYTSVKSTNDQYRAELSSPIEKEQAEESGEAICGNNEIPMLERGQSVSYELS